MAETKATSFKRKQNLKQKPWPSCPGAQQVHSLESTLVGVLGASCLSGRVKDKEPRCQPERHSMLFKSFQRSSVRNPSHSAVFILSPWISHLTNHFSLPRQRARKHSYSKLSPISNRSPAQNALWLSGTVGYLRWQALWQAVYFLPTGRLGGLCAACWSHRKTARPTKMIGLT